MIPFITSFYLLIFSSTASTLVSVWIVSSIPCWDVHSEVLTALEAVNHCSRTEERYDCSNSSFYLPIYCMDYRSP